MHDIHQDPDRRSIPSEAGWDHTLALYREGYDFIANRCTRFQSDIFETRLMLQRVICMKGREAAEMFYQPDRFTRKGAVPVNVVTLLQGFKSVQLLDHAPHRHRKQLFLSLTGDNSARHMARLFTEQWQRRRAPCIGQEIVLFDWVRAVLTTSVLTWAGIVSSEKSDQRRLQEFSAMIEKTGTIGPSALRAIWLRKRSESWATDLIRETRVSGQATNDLTPLQAVAFHRDLNGNLLDAHTAAVELLNLLRPVVATARFIVYAAKALHEHPDVRQRVATDDERYLSAFADEVRRTASFFPAIGGRVLEPFTWRGHDFRKDDWVLLDLDGTNRDPRTWGNPHEFRPERFLSGHDLYSFVPQGGGVVETTHRCPGETVTHEILKAATRQLCEPDIETPAQDLSVDRTKIPALPRSGYSLRFV